MLATTANPVSVKVVGTNGQISLGKQFAGRQVLIEEIEAGVGLVRTATVVPDDERWLHTTMAADLSNALAWAANSPPSGAAVDGALARLDHGDE